jgi:hypothetical protein
MESPGKCLKAERESRNLSLKQVSESTKIKERLLKDIEDDQYEHLPHPVYVKGFLTAYARYLGLDPHDIILRYQKYVESLTLSKELGLKQRMPPSKKRVNLWLSIIIFGIILLIAIFIYSIPLKHMRGFLPSFEKKESVPIPLPSMPSSLPIQKEVETQPTNQSEKSQTARPTDIKEAILPESLQFEVVEASLGTGIERKDDFLILTGKCSEFVCNNQRAYFLTRIKAKREGKVVHVWLRKGREFYKKEIEVKSPEWSVYSFITLRFQHEGDWKAEARDGNKVLAVLGFNAYELSHHSNSKKQ